VGSLEVGKEADFVVVDPRSPDVGPVWDVYATYVLACGLRNLREVWVGGRLASRDGVATAAVAAQAPQELRTRTARLAAATGHRLPLEPSHVASPAATVAEPA
jgi:5-methylthioadenosine/S-adenosylhomocysteine deaminase